jgi:serine/threonine protein kinase
VPTSRALGGRWEIVSSLGEGGQAHTFLVRDAQGEFSEPMVLKRLKNPQRLGRFGREVSALRSLRSDRIPPPVDYNLVVCRLID